MQCAVKQHALPCHDITAITDPAHAHEICTKTLKVVEKVTDPSRKVYSVFSTVFLLLLLLVVAVGCPAAGFG